MLLTVLFANVFLTVNNDDATIGVADSSAVNAVGGGTNSLLAIRRSHVTNGSSLIEVDKFYLLTSRSGNIIEIGGRQRSGRNLRGIGHNGVWHDVGLHQGIGVVASSSGEGRTVGHLQFGVATQAQVRPEWADGNEELKKTVRLFPHHLKGEGHFIAKLVNGEPESTDKKRKKKNKRKKQSIVKPDKEQVKLFNQFITSVFPDYQPHQLILFGDQLYDLPLEEDKIEGLNVLRPGLHLGTFKKNRFEPALAWALASLPQEANQVIELSQEQWHQYVHGDVINIDADLPNGWYLLVCEEHTAGFGKLVGKTIKNFYPKGLRF